MFVILRAGYTNGMARKSNLVTGVLLLAVVAVGGLGATHIKPGATGANNTDVAASQSASSLRFAPSSELALITEPTAGIQPIVSAITSAQTSIKLVMYELEDTAVEQALVSAKQRGVMVQVLLNKGYYGEQSQDNEAAYTDLANNGVSVRWTPSYFALTHQKTMVIDSRSAYILTFNFTPQYYASSRDFGVVDNDENDVRAIDATFSADWNDERIKPGNGDSLVWSPGSQSAMLNLISGAQHSLDIYNEEMDDGPIETALENAAKRGVTVDVVMTNSSDWAAAFSKLKTSGVNIHVFEASAREYIHAKMILVDGNKAFLGSENFSSGSLSHNRELGVVTNDPAILSSLTATFANDYAAASSY
jgi:phosphatidylserine/phosphatidylglycerophosphate/cardiolipin synthase-like enzyme